MKILSLSITSTFALLFAIPAPRLLADGCYILRTEIIGQTASASSPKQEALLVYDGKTAHVTLRTHFRAGPRELAWIIPVPNKPTQVGTAPDAIFTDLEQQSAPHFYRVTHSHGLSCGCAAAPVSPLALSSKVNVESTGTAGVFQYVVLNASDPNELSRWLTENQYRIPAGAEKTFSHYVRQGWHWLAMRVSADALENATLAPHPVTFSYPADRLVYPLVISQLSAAEENDIVLYVLASSRYACANWENSTIDLQTVELDSAAPSGTTYDRQLRQRTLHMRGNVFVTEYASNIFRSNLLPRIQQGISPREYESVTYLTRLRAVISPGQMDRDVELMKMPPFGNVDNRRYFSAAATDRSLAILMPIGAVGLTKTGVQCSRRTGRVRKLAAIFLALGCLCFTML